MKTILTVILSLALATSTIAQTNTPAPQMTAFEAIFATAIVIVGVACVISVWNCSKRVPPGAGTPATVTLYKSSDNATWTFVTATNVVLTGNDPMEVFRETATDTCAFYKVQVQRQ
jgi:hypothetical protein